jgi:hypothetical protein
MYEWGAVKIRVIYQICLDGVLAAALHAQPNRIPCSTVAV